MIEFSFQFSPFITLKVEHNYYSKTLKKDLKFVPASETLEIVRQTGLVLKETELGFTLSYDVSEPESLLRYLKGHDAVSLSYFLVTSNYFFTNLTDMSPESIGSAFYFNSKNGKSQKDDNYLLHKGDYVSMDDSKTLVSGDYKYPLKNSKKATLELKDYNGKVVISEELEGKEDYTFMLDKLPQGYYSIVENGKEASNFILVRDSFQRKPIVAVATINLEGKERDEIIATLERGEVLPSKTYTVHFEARATYWKYFFVSKYKLPLAKSSIVTNEKDIVFEGPEKVELPNGDTAFVFQSKVPLPLKEMPEYNFKLSKSKGDNGEAYLNRLPTPSPDSIKPESREASSKIYSELIVYV